MERVFCMHAELFQVQSNPSVCHVLASFPVSTEAVSNFVPFKKKNILSMPQCKSHDHLLLTCFGRFTAANQNAERHLDVSLSHRFVLDMLTTAPLQSSGGN